MELVSWYAYDGTPLEGLLYKPEDFDPNKKYLMIVYFYEKKTTPIIGITVPNPVLRP